MFRGVVILLASVSILSSAYASEWDAVIENFGIREDTSETLRTELATRNDLTQHQLVHVTSDAMPGYLDIVVVLDGNFNLHSGAVIMDDGRKTLFTPEQLPRGVVIDRRDGRDIATLYSRDLNVQIGGNISLVYLSNGITGSTGSYPMQIARYGNNWYLRTVQGEVFTNIFLKGKFFFGKAIGISSVHVSR
jgi:hypothetical protein